MLWYITHTGTHTQTCTYLQPAITKQTNSRSIKTKAVVRSCLCRPVAPLSWRSPFPIASLPKDANGVRVAWCPGSPSLIEFALIVRRRSLTVVDMLLEGRGVEPKHIFVSVGCLLLFFIFLLIYSFSDKKKRKNIVFLLFHSSNDWKTDPSVPALKGDSFPLRAAS